MVHENDEARGGCQFGIFFDGRTPPELQGIYDDLAIALYPGPFFSVSVALVAKALGATQPILWFGSRFCSASAERAPVATAAPANPANASQKDARPLLGQKIDDDCAREPQLDSSGPSVPESGGPLKVLTREKSAMFGWDADESLSAAAKFRNSAALSSSSSSQPGEEIQEMSQQEIARRRRESIKATEAYRESIKETEAYLRSCNEVSKEHPGREWRPKPSTTKPKVRRLPKPAGDLQKVGHLAQLSASFSPRRATHEPSGETRSEAGPSQASGVGLEASLTHAGVGATSAAVPHARDGVSIRV